MCQAMSIQKVHQKLQNNMSKEREGFILKEGSLHLLQPVGNKVRSVPVSVKIYRNCFEHYAVVSKAHLFGNKSTFISLKNCFVFPREGHTTQLRIVPNAIEGNNVIFDIGDEESVSEWMDALQSDSQPSSPQRVSISPNLSPVIPRSPILQTLTETEEKE